MFEKDIYKLDFEIDKKLASIKSKKINLKKYVGILKGEIDGLAYQEKIRSEWS
jgi:hypothetical protein